MSFRGFPDCLKNLSGNRRESYFVDFYAHDQNLGQVDQALRRTVFDLLISLLWFIYGLSMVFLCFFYGFLSDSAGFSMVFCILCSRGCNKKSLGHLRWPKFGPAK